MGGAMVGVATFGVTTPSMDWTLPARACPCFSRRGASILTRRLPTWLAEPANVGDGWAEDRTGEVGDMALVRIDCGDCWWWFCCCCSGNVGCVRFLEGDAGLECNCTVLDPATDEALVFGRGGLEPLDTVEPDPELRADNLASTSGTPLA